jgi:hypothetical protein
MRKLFALITVVASFAAWAQEQSESVPRLLNARDLSFTVDSETLERQYAALVAMSPQQVEYSARGLVESIQGVANLTLPSNVRDLKIGNEAATTLFPLLGDVLLARGNESLIVITNSPMGTSARALRLSQSIRGIPVIHSMVAIDYDESTLRVKGLSANFVPDRGLPRDPKLSAQEAERIVPESLKSIKDYQQVEIEIRDGTHLAYYANPGEPQPPQLVWVVETALGSSIEQFFVDATSGVIAGRLQLSSFITPTV